MKKNAFKKLLLSISSLKVLLGLGALMVSGSGTVEAAPSDSPLLSQSQPSQADVAKLVESIKTAASGNVSGNNVGASITAALGNNPGVTPQMLAAAINQLNLQGDTLAKAINTGADKFGITPGQLSSAVVTDALITGGKDAANERKGDLGSLYVGSAEDLANIQPAAGDDSDDSVYNG